MKQEVKLCLSFMWRHRDQKPLSIVKDFILASSNEGDLVLDCFGGSGTTAQACSDTNRQFIIIEKDVNNFEMIKKRLNSNDNK